MGQFDPAITFSYNPSGIYLVRYPQPLREVRE